MVDLAFVKVPQFVQDLWFVGKQVATGFGVLVHCYRAIVDAIVNPTAWDGEFLDQLRYGEETVDTSWMGLARTL